MNSNYVKILILGASWSGKSTLAKKASELLNIIHFDLDDIDREEKYSKKRISETKVHLLHQTLETNQKRIMEWCFVDWIDEAMQQANIVIILDIPNHILLRRHIKRHITDILFWKRVWDIKSTYKLIKWSFSYQDPKAKYSKLRHITDCEKYGTKYIVCKNTKNIIKDLM